VRKPSALQLCLALMCAGLGAVIYDELDRPPLPPAAKAEPVPAQTPRAVVAPASSDFAMPALRDYGEVAARPLFAATRRPPPTAARQRPAPAAFSLVGVVISSSGRHALIEHGQPARLERVAEGQMVDGWTIETILPDRIVVREADARQEIRPKDSPPKIATVPAAVVPTRQPPYSGTTAPMPVGPTPGEAGAAVAPLPSRNAAPPRR
jgi:general secretion pathway protein N